MYLKLLTRTDAADYKRANRHINPEVGCMETEKLKQFYKEQLVRAGVDFHKAEQAVSNMTGEELKLIHDIWSDWAVVFPRTEDELLGSVEMS